MNNKNKLNSFLIGIIIGALLAASAVFFTYKDLKNHPGIEKKLLNVLHFCKIILFHWPVAGNQMIEKFSEPITVENSRSFGKHGQLTFEMYRDGTFQVDGKSGYALQKSSHYSDVALIRSTKALPKTYKISVEVGAINYDLDLISGLPNDPNYPEGPKNENGCYLISISDVEPSGHHTNVWWHQHRKVVIDVDNNVWGNGMPHPIFMVYFDENNELVSFDGSADRWQKDWRKAVTYEPTRWYRIEVEKTATQFILRIYDIKGTILKEGKADLNNVWHEDGDYPDYFSIGDPHENYYQGSMKIKSISMPEERK